jgi:hypothetical protein
MVATKHDRGVKARGRHTTPNTRRETGEEGEELRQAVTPGQLQSVMSHFDLSMMS